MGTCLLCYNWPGLSSAVSRVFMSFVGGTLVLLLFVESPVILPCGCDRRILRSHSLHHLGVETEYSFFEEGSSIPGKAN